ncbi:MAG TPA: sialidase family protein [Candidatus Acidoferrum sp.]|nr:sialidase family protein [Candidatus Acidoferrum sp.]
MDGSIHFSTNSGLTWGSLLAVDMIGVACSADGVWMAVFGNGGYVFSSSNSGASWESPGAIPNPWYGDGAYEYFSVGSSVDGRILLVAAGRSRFSPPFAGLFSSTNSGQTWVSNSLPTNEGWQGAALSTDGTKGFVVNSLGQVYSLPNPGGIWVSNSAPALSWQSVACSADGAVAYAAPSNGSIWKLLTAPSPLLGITSSSNSVRLSWLVPSENLVLQQNAALNVGAWSDVTNVPILNLSTLREEVALPAGASATFYRLSVR